MKAKEVAGGWPDIDREGEYKEQINEMKHDLKMGMHLVRNIVLIRKKKSTLNFETLNLKNMPFSIPP